MLFVFYNHLVIFPGKPLAGKSGDRIPVGARFSVPVQTGPGVHQVSFPGVKRPGRRLDPPPSSSAKVKERVALYFYSLSGPS